MITTWFAHLDRASNIPEVISVVRDYLASWTPPDLALLPEKCRPPRMRDESDVEDLHSTLVEEYRMTRASGKDLEALQRLTSFIARAAIRLAELGAPAGGERDASAGNPARSTAPRES